MLSGMPPRPMGAPPVGMWPPHAASTIGPQPPPGARPPLFPAATSQAPPQPSLSATAAEAAPTVAPPAFHAATPPTTVAQPSAAPAASSPTQSASTPTTPLPSGIKKIDASGAGQIIVHPDEDISLVRILSPCSHSTLPPSLLTLPRSSPFILRSSPFILRSSLLPCLHLTNVRLILQEEKRAKLPKYNGGSASGGSVHYSSGMIRY